MATRAAFIERVIDEITEGRSIPVQPKPDRISKIIDTALKYFWQYDDEAHEFEYVIISAATLETDLFKRRRQIKLPDCVHAITGLQEVGYQYGYQYNEVSPDYRKTNFNFHLALSGDSDSMIYGVVASYYADFMRNFVVRTVAFEYSEHSHMLTVLGRDTMNTKNRDKNYGSGGGSGTDMVAKAYVYMCEEALFESDRFFRYVCGKAKISFANVMGFAEMNLIGGVALSIDEIRQQGKDLVEEVREEIESQKDTLDFWEEF